MAKHCDLRFTLPLFLWLWHVLSACAVLRNATIDDRYGDSLTGVIPHFFPAEGQVWEGEVSEECSCPIKPDSRYTFLNTYNAATYKPDQGVNLVAIQMQFTGESLDFFPALTSRLTTQPPRKI
jgi:hypothetical protein